MIIAPGAASVSVDVFFADDTGAAVTGKVAADFPACKWSNGDNTADTTITLSDLAAITTAHPNNNTAGGVKEREGGWYRLDLPNNMVTSAGRKTLTFAETTNKRIIAPPIDCQYVQGKLADTSHGGTSTTLTFERFIGASTTSNEPCVKLIGNGTGAGLLSTGGATDAPGVKIAGGASDGTALHLVGSGSGRGLYAVGGSTGDGALISCGASSGTGLTVQGGTSGSGLQISCGSANSPALYINGGSGGTSGHAVKIVGGATGGNGINVVTTSGHGINIAPVGTSMHGVLITGGNGGTSDGLKLAAGTGGVGFRLDTLTASGAVTISGTTALQALTLTTLTASGAVALQSTLAITGLVSAAAGVTITQSTTNGVGLSITGNGTGAGVSATGGATGAGLALAGGGTSGDGLNVTVTSGHGFNIVATGTAKDAIHLVGAAAATTNAGGHGLNVIGGAASTSSGGTAGIGFKALGGAGAASTNGAGEGVTFVGGGTTTVSGANGFSSTGTGNLSGVNFVGAGSGNGMLLTKGSSGDGFKTDTINATSTLTVSGTTSLAALSMTTLTASGAVAFQSTLAVTGTTTLTGAVQLGSTLGITGAVTLSSTLAVGNTTLNALTVTNALLVSGTTTLHGAVAFDSTWTATGAVSFGSTFAITGNLTAANLTNARIGYLDNLNVGGAVASHADIDALNQSASRRIVIATVGQYERPESGTSTYTVELRTFDGDGAAINADSTPTITPTGIVSGDLSANLGAVSNPATGVYRATYSVTSGATSEQIRFGASATISSSTFTITAYTQVVDEVSQTWTSTDATHLTAIFNKLPSNNIADETLVIAAIGTPAQAGTALSTAQWTSALATNLGTLAGHDPGATLSTLTQSQVTGGSYPLSNASFAFNTAFDFTTTQKTSLNNSTPTIGNVTLAATQSLYAPAKAGNAMTLTGGERDSIAAALLDLADGIESGKTLRQCLRLIAAGIAGKRSNAGTVNEQYDAVGSPGTARIVGNLDSSGNGTPTLTP